MLSSGSIWTGGAGELHARNLDSTWETVHLAGCCLLFFLACLIDQQLKMNRSQSFVSVVFDVMGPCLALDVDDDSTNRTLKMHRNQWAQIALRVLIWVVVSRKTTARVVLDWSNVFNISRVLTLARYPNSVHCMLFHVVNVLDVFLQILGHVGWQFRGVVVAIRNPSVDSVQLQEYTRGALVIVVVVLQSAWTILLDVNIAHGPWWGFLSVITVVDILSSARNLTRCSVFLKEIVQCISPLLEIPFLSAFVPDERTFDVVF